MAAQQGSTFAARDHARANRQTICKHKQQFFVLQWDAV
jgi:hypothetical protein